MTEHPPPQAPEDGGRTPDGERRAQHSAFVSLPLDIVIVVTGYLPIDDLMRRLQLVSHPYRALLGPHATQRSLAFWAARWQRDRSDSRCDGMRSLAFGWRLP